MADSPLALSVEKVRHEMLRGLLIPREMVNKAILKTYEQLEAQETKVFTHQGRIVSKIDLPAHEVQASATDRIFSLAGLYARERENSVATPGFAMEVNPVTGVVRIIVGDVGVAPTLELPPVQASPAEALVVNHAHDRMPEASVSQKPGRAAVSSDTWKILSDEIVE